MVFPIGEFLALDIFYKQVPKMSVVWKWSNGCQQEIKKKQIPIS